MPCVTKYAAQFGAPSHVFEHSASAPLDTHPHTERWRGVSSVNVLVVPGESGGIPRGFAEHRRPACSMVRNNYLCVLSSTCEICGASASFVLQFGYIAERVGFDSGMSNDMADRICPTKTNQNL